jgi:hypothetical protein
MFQTLKVLEGPLAIHDDQAAIVRQEWLYQFPSIWPHTIKAQRPIVELFNRWTYRRWGFSPRAWHIGNVVLHAIACAVLFVLLRRLGLEHALWTVLAFAVHPVQAHSWAYVTGRSGILAAIFLFTAALVYLSSWPVAATIPVLLAVASREDSIVFLIWLPLLERFR